MKTISHPYHGYGTTLVPPRVGISRKQEQNSYFTLLFMQKKQLSRFPIKPNYLVPFFSIDLIVFWKFLSLTWFWSNEATIFCRYMYLSGLSPCCDQTRHNTTVNMWNIFCQIFVLSDFSDASKNAMLFPIVNPLYLIYFIAWEIGKLESFQSSRRNDII